MYDYALTSLIDVLRLLVSWDSSSLIYVFPTKARNNPQARPIRPRSWQDQPPDRAILEIYAHQIWLRAGNRSFLRFLVGHDKSYKELFCPTLQTDLEARELFLEVDHIQAATIVTCGFLVGSYMKSFNVDSYNALLSTIPKFASFPVSVIKENVQLIARGGMVQESLQLMYNVMP